MDKNTLRGFICGFLIGAIFMTSIPVYADGTTAYDSIVSAISGNNLNTKLNTLNTNLANLTTAVNNLQASTGNGNIKAKLVTTSLNTQVTGPGFILGYPYSTGQRDYSYIRYTADSNSDYAYFGSEQYGTSLAIGYGFAAPVYFAQSAKVTQCNNCSFAIYQYI